MEWVRHKSGEVINGYTLLRKDVKKQWLVQHSCGRTYSARPHLLHKQKHCRGCHPNGEQHYAWRGVGELSHDLFNTYKNSAIARGLDFTVSIEYMWNLFMLQSRKCALTGQEIYFNKTYKGKKNKTASPDRIDSTLGYIEGNIQWTHRDVNRLKRNMPNDKFIELCQAVARHISHEHD